MKTVWLAWWDNGLEYEDHDITFVGVYTTKELADKAGKEYNSYIHSDSVFHHVFDNSSWYVSEEELDAA